MIGFIWKMGYSRKMASSGKKKGRSRLRVVSLHLFLRSMMPSYTILTAEFGQVLLHWDVLHLGHAGPIAVHHGLPSQIAPCFAELKGDACLRQETLPMLVKEMLLLSFLGSVFLGKISYRWIQAPGNGDWDCNFCLFCFDELDPNLWPKFEPAKN